jgi:predicted MFS family arabinose efflux permease
MSVFDIGSIMSLYFPVYAISQLPAGYLLDRFGVRVVLTISCLVVSVGLFLISFPQESTLIDGRILIAIGSAFAFLGALKTASGCLPERFFPLAVGLTNSIGVIGGILGLPFLNHLIVEFNWEIAIRFIAYFGVVLAFFLLVFLSVPKNKIQENKDHFITHIFRDRQIWFLAIYAGIMVGTVVNAFSELYDVNFLETVLNISSQSAAQISSMIFIGIGVGGPSHGIIAKLFKQTKSWMLIACFATIISFSLIILSSIVDYSYATMYVLYFFTGFFVSSMLLSFDVAKRSYDKSLHATIFALVNMVISLGGFIFQYLLSYLLESKLGYDASFLALLIPLLVSLILCYKFNDIPI